MDWKSTWWIVVCFASVMMCFAHFSMQKYGAQKSCTQQYYVKKQKHYFHCNTAQSLGSFLSFPSLCIASYDEAFMDWKLTWWIVVFFASVMMCFAHFSMQKCGMQKSVVSLFYLLIKTSFAQSISPNSPC